MIMQALLKTTILAATTMAASLPTRRATGSAYNFLLAANVTNFDLTPSIQGWELSYAPNADCLANITLTPPSTEGSGAIFYTTSDTVEVADFSGSSPSAAAGLIVTPGGTATVPSWNNVKLQCDASTSGVTVAAEDGDVWDLQFQGGSWMACPRYGVVVLSFKKAGQRTLEGCADVQMLPVCDYTQGTVDGSQEVECQTA